MLIQGLDPILQIDPNTAGHTDRSEEDGRDAIGPPNDGRNVDERYIGTGLNAGPERDVVHLDIRDEPTPMVPFSATSITLLSGCWAFRSSRTF